MSAVLAAAGAAAGIFGSNALSAYYDRHAASLAYDRQVDLFDYIAAYNHPVAQMDRLREAGLNPNLVYGGNAVGSVSSAPSVSGGSRSRGSEFDITGALQQYQQYRTGQAQERQLDAQSRNLASVNENLHVQNSLYEAQAERERTEVERIKQGLPPVPTDSLHGRAIEGIRATANNASNSVGDFFGRLMSSHSASVGDVERSKALAREVLGKSDVSSLTKEEALRVDRERRRLLGVEQSKKKGSGSSWDRFWNPYKYR